MIHRNSICVQNERVGVFKRLRAVLRKYGSTAVLATFVSAGVYAEIKVETSQFEAERHDITLQTQGFLLPFQETNISSQVVGEVNSISGDFEPGIFVEKGTVLFTIENTNYLASLADAQQSLSEAKLSLEDEKARAERAKRDWERTQNTKPNELVGRDLYVDAAQAKHNAAIANLKKAERELSLTKIRAPYDGIVQSRAVSKGNFVQPGEILGSLVQSDIAVIDLPLKISDLEHFNELAIQDIQLELYSDTHLKGKSWGAEVTGLSPNLHKIEQRANLRARVPLTNEEKHKLFLNQYVVAKITIPSDQMLFAIPETAFTQRNSVLTVKGGVVSEFFPEVVYQYQGKKYCFIGQQNSIEVITATPDLYWNGAEVDSIKLTKK